MSGSAIEALLASLRVLPHEVLLRDVVGQLVRLNPELQSDVEELAAAALVRSAAAAAAEGGGVRVITDGSGVAGVPKCRPSVV